MKLRTLECFCEIAANGFNFSRAAKALHATQPAITRQIQLLERELGFAVFERRGTKAFKLTPAGQVTFRRAQKIVSEARELCQIRDDLSEDATKKITVATTEFHARYTLLPAIKAFRSDHPRVALSIVSVDPNTCAEMVTAGNADFALCSRTPEAAEKLLSYKCLDVGRVAIVPRGHPLTNTKHPSLRQIAAFPLVVYDSRLSGGRDVLDLLEEHGIKFEVALSAMTADVIKSYVAAGMGIGIIQASAFDNDKDKELCALDSSRLFRPRSVYILLSKNIPTRTIVREFISLLATETGTFESSAFVDADSDIASRTPISVKVN